MNDKEDTKNNVILFPLDRIKDKTMAKGVNEAQHRRIVEEQTKEFVEGNVDEIAYYLLDKFVNMGIRTQALTFTTDLALVIDAIRGLAYRDFGKGHPAQQLADKMVTIKIDKDGKRKSAKLNYSSVIDQKHKPHTPLSKDVEEELKDLSDMGNIHFEPDFDPEDK